MNPLILLLILIFTELSSLWDNMGMFRVAWPPPEDSSNFHPALDMPSGSCLKSTGFLPYPKEIPMLNGNIIHTKKRWTILWDSNSRGHMVSCLIKLKRAVSLNQGMYTDFKRKGETIYSGR